MTDEAKEAERLRLARMDLAQLLSEPLDFALASKMQSESALIAMLINAILTNRTTELLMVLRTTKPGA